jgi:DNA-binding transcriptional ArsR family regulator
LNLDARQKLAALEAVCVGVSHAARRQILLAVHLRGMMTAGEIAARFDHAWATTTGHLSVLLEAGLLRQERRGRNRVYEVDRSRLQLLCEWLAWFDLPEATGKNKTDTRSREMTERDALKKLRNISRDLPEVVETTTYGHPTFQAGKKRTFAVVDDHEQKGMLCLVIKIDPPKQASLVDGIRFFPSKFGAKHGWTAMKIDAGTDWTLASKLVVDSYRRVALKRMVEALKV